MSAAPGSSAAPAPTARQRRSRWALWAAVMLLVGIGFVLLFLLAQATNNRLLYERYYTRLFVVNVAVAAVLALVIGWGGIGCWRACGAASSAAGCSSSWRRFSGWWACCPAC